MRRLILICEILVVSLIILKIAAAGGVLQKMMPDASVFDPDQAVANVAQKAPEAAPARETGDDALAKERKLVASLAEKEKQLESRESAIKEEEKKLQVLKGEIVTKIDTLKGLEDRLSGMLDTVKVRRGQAAQGPCHRLRGNDARPGRPHAGEDGQEACRRDHHEHEEQEGGSDLGAHRSRSGPPKSPRKSRRRPNRVGINRISSVHSALTLCPAVAKGAGTRG